MGLLSGWPSPRLRGDVRISQVPGGPSCTRPALRPRWSPGAASFSRAGMLPSAIPTASASTTNQISGLDHAAHALAVYASRRGSLPLAQDSLPAGRTALAGRGFPARSLEMFLVITSSSSRFSLAQRDEGPKRHRIAGSERLDLEHEGQALHLAEGDDGVAGRAPCDVVRTEP